MTSFNEQLLSIVETYQKEHPGPFTSKQVAAFALNGKLYEPHHGRMLSVVAEEFSRAMREQYIEDPQGRSVRAKHSARLVVEASIRLSRGSCRSPSRIAASRSLAIASN